MIDRLLVLLIGILALEMLFQATFTRFYFQLGVPVFRRTIKCSLVGKLIPSSDQIEFSLPESKFQEFRFKSLDSSHFGFREQFFGGVFQMAYTPVMHGLLSFDRRRGIVSVTGYANWFTLAFIFFFAQGMAQDDAFLFALALAAIIGVIYAIQAKRFSDVAEVAVDHVLSNQ